MHVARLLSLRSLLWSRVCVAPRDAWTPCGRQHAIGRSYRIFRYNTFHHIGHISTLAQPTNRYNPGCYAHLYDWLLPAEVFNDKECPEDDLWPCREAARHTPAFFPPGRLSWSADKWKASALSPEKQVVTGALDELRPLGRQGGSSSSDSSSEGGDDGAGAGGAEAQPVLRTEARPVGETSITTVVGRLGVSCTTACQRQRPGSRCDINGLKLLNACDALKQHRGSGCPRGCDVSVGPDQPAYVSVDAPAASMPGSCLVNSGALSCDGKHELTRRLCACT